MLRRCRFPIVLLILLSPVVSAQPQNDINTVRGFSGPLAYRGDFGIGTRWGLTQYQGDVHDGMIFSEPEVPFSPAGDIFLYLRLQELAGVAQLGVEFAGGYRKFRASHDLYEFTTKAYPFTLTATAEFFTESRIRPTFSLGLGVLPYSLDVHRVSPGLPSFKEKTGAERRYPLWIPVRFGAMFSLSTELEVQAVYERSVTFSDRVDGLVSQTLDWFNDNFQSLSLGLTFFFGGRILVMDSDRDGLFDAEEVATETDPQNPDTDKDGLSDGDEVFRYQTDPKRVDTDRDGINDFDEVRKYRTSPRTADTDGDGLKDGDELLVGADPHNPDTDGDNIRDGLDLCVKEAETYNAFEDSDGCPDQEKHEESKIASVSAAIVMENIEYPLDNDDLLPANLEPLDRVATVLREKFNVYFEVGGHMDARGSSNRQVMLSWRRAEAVRNYLVNKGIDPRRIRAHGYGSSAPIAPNDTPQDRARNCRVEFKVIRVAE